MKFELREPMTVFAKLKGPKGAVRELRALMDFNTSFCQMFTKDALQLGFTEGVLRPRDWQRIHPTQVPYIFGFRGIERGILMKMPEISVGRLTARDVDAMVTDLDLPRLLPVELILGRSFLDNFRLTVDGPEGTISLDAGKSASGAVRKRTPPKSAIQGRPKTAAP